MRPQFLRFLVAAALATLGIPGHAFSQNLTVGIGLQDDSKVNPVGTQTIVDMWEPANLDEQLTTAVFGWSASPCPAAVKIKVFRPSASLIERDFDRPASFEFVGERGPFDVTEPIRTDTFVPQAFQTVALTPPLEIQAGDVIAITNMTACGGPIYQHNISNFFSAPGGSFSVPGDVSSSIPNPHHKDPWVFVVAQGTSVEFGLLGGRFVASLVATNPRTGGTAIGKPVVLSDGAGYFSLPDFTGDPAFPEVMVKMVDASREPALGADFWFFHAPLTDVRYTITVKDQVTGAVRSYSGANASGQLCGGVDTSAFPGP